MRRARYAAVLLGVIGAGCRDGADHTSPPVAAPLVVRPAEAPLEWIPRSFLVRPSDEDWVERIPRAEVGEVFLVQVAVQVRTPAEGPWNLTLTRTDEPGEIRIPDLRVDPASGRIQILMRTKELPDGDYRLRLELAGGGMALGPKTQDFRFRIS